MANSDHPDELDVLQFGSAPVRRRRHNRDEPDDVRDPLRLNLDEDAPAADHSRPRRTRRARAAIITVGALAVVAGGFVLRSPPEPQAGQPQQGTPAVAGDVGTAPDGLQLVSVRFADPRHGYALAAACTPGTARTCRYLFRVTADGGGTWEYQSVPLTAGTLLREPPPTIATVGPLGVRLVGAGQRWFSPNAGRTWEQPTYSPRAAVQQVPPGSVIEPLCRPSCTGFRATDPATGVRLELANPPAITALPPAGQPPQPSDGSAWVTGRSGTSGPPAVAVSRDRGRSWRITTLPPTAAPLDSVVVLTADGQTAYAFVRTVGPADPSDGEHQGVDNGLAAVYVTDDGGGTWRLVRDAHLDPYARPGQPASLVGALLLPSGRILITTEEYGMANLRYSDDGGRTFARLINGPEPQLTSLDDAGGRIIAQGALGGFYTSTDGEHWQPVRLR